MPYLSLSGGVKIPNVDVAAINRINYQLTIGVQTNLAGKDKIEADLINGCPRVEYRADDDSLIMAYEGYTQVVRTSYEYDDGVLWLWFRKERE